jgi:dephospho-CoA kinase
LAAIADEADRLVVCICGRAASGKSTVARRFATAGWQLMESGKVVAALLESESIHDLDVPSSMEFRSRAMRLVTGPQPTALVQALAGGLATASARVAVVGVRQVSTVDGLRGCANGRVVVLYVETSLTKCAERFALRDGKRVDDYLAIAGHEVEQDQERLRTMADRVIDNDGPLDVLYGHADLLAQEWSKES